VPKWLLKGLLVHSLPLRREAERITMSRYPHLRLMKRTWFVQLGIPADVRHAFGGKKLFTRSTGKRNETEANVVAGPIVFGWKAEIEAVRRGLGKPIRDEAERLASEYRRFHGKPLDEAAMALILDTINFVTERTSATRLAEAVRQVTIPGSAKELFDTITGRTTPFLTFIDDYEAVAKVRDGTLKQAISGITKFALAVPKPLQALTGGDVQAWLYALKSEKTGENADHNTKQRRLSELRGYWAHLVAMGHVDGSTNPFTNRITANQETEGEAQDRKRQGFRPDEVPTLWQQAEADHDKPLAALIRIAAHTGGRLGELMSLTTSSIMDDHGIACLRVAEQGKRRKTRAARRVVPIHPAITELITELANNPDVDGFLIACGAKNRSAAMSKRFGRMKSDMKYDEYHVFHSLRHTVIQMFREARCPLEVRNLIVGHEDGDEKANTGAAYGDLSAKGRLGWIQGAIQYP
jgi:integrase